MSWIRGSASNYLTLSDALVAAASGNSVATVAVNAGGTGYTVGDILSVAGGTGTVTAQIEVTTISGGGGTGPITGVRIYNAGVYTANPSTPNSVTGGTGSSATITLTFVDNGWTAERDSTWSGSQKEVILSSAGDGGDAIYVGWRTLSNSSTYYNWELHGMTGYSSGQNMEGQPGVSPGFHDNATTDNRAGAYLLLFNSTIDYWFSITPYRIIVIVKVGSNFFNAYLGWGSRFMTETEYPYPMVVVGHSSAWDALYNQSTLSSGLVDPWRSASGDGSTNGPMLVRFTDGQWYGVANQSVGLNSLSGVRVRNVLPAATPGGAFTGQGDTPATEAKDLFFGSTASFIDVFPNTGAASSATANLENTPGTVDIKVVLPAFIVFYSPSAQAVCELTDVYWASGFGGVVSEDRIIVSGAVYRLFQNCNRSSNFAFVAVKEV
jgi:hypothetical protein